MNKLTFDDMKSISKNIEISCLEDRLNKNLFWDSYYEKYKSNFPQDEDRPFLTVLIRTQGKRLDGLRECLLCLNAQVFEDFEVIIVGHKVEEQAESHIKEIIEEQYGKFRDRICYVPLKEGTRTAPLNLGFSLARGKYISVYDDDDIVFDYWTKDYYEAAKIADGKILRTYAVSQTWRQLENLGLRAEKEIKATYCKNFNMLEQLVVNRTPLMTLAFPLYLFQKLGITFNESLNITEDWEYLMRCVYVCGIYDIEQPTTIYRFWENVETSATAHNKEEWDIAYKGILKGLTQNGLYLNPEVSAQLIDCLTADSFGLTSERKRNDVYRMFYSYGGLFSDDQIIYSENIVGYPFFNCWFSFEECLLRMKALRIDLGNEGMFLLKDLKIEVIYMDDEVELIPLKKCAHTGLNLFGEIVFLFENPSVVWEIPDKMVKYVHVSGTISRNLSRTRVSAKIFEMIHALKYRKQNQQLHRKGWF